MFVHLNIHVRTWVVQNLYPSLSSCDGTALQATTTKTRTSRVPSVKEKNTLRVAKTKGLVGAFIRSKYTAEKHEKLRCAYLLNNLVHALSLLYGASDERSAGEPTVVPTAHEDKHHLTLAVARVSNDRARQKKITKNVSRTDRIATQRHDACNRNQTHLFFSVQRERSLLEAKRHRSERLSKRLHECKWVHSSRLGATALTALSYWVS